MCCVSTNNMSAGRVSSFQKRIKSAGTGIPGTRPSIQNSQLLISSGIPSLDSIVGGGLPVGSIVVIEEDKHGTFARLFMKYFLAEGVMSKHALHIASLDVDPQQLAQQLPGPAESGQEAADRAGQEDSDLTIAWRYQNMKTVSSTPASSQHCGHHFDLTKAMGAEAMQAVDVTYWSQGGEGAEDFSDSAWGSLLRSVVARLQSLAGGTVLRLGLVGLGSPLWPPQHLPRFLCTLRALLRTAFATALVTVPTHLHRCASTLVQGCVHLSDLCVGLQALCGSPLEALPPLRDYHGLLRVVKLAAVNSLARHVPPTQDLAFKLRRRRLVIEHIHLPPELEDSAEREQDDTPSAGCGSGRRSKLDF